MIVVFGCRQRYGNNDDETSSIHTHISILYSTTTTTKKHIDDDRRRFFENQTIKYQIPKSEIRK